MTTITKGLVVRAELAHALIRLAIRLLEGGDDRRVILNTRRLRARPGTPAAGRVLAFIGPEDDAHAALAFAPNEVPTRMGTPVPAWVARLAGWKVIGV
jgi:hypothetical protein